MHPHQGADSLSNFPGEYYGTSAYFYAVAGNSECNDTSTRQGSSVPRSPNSRCGIAGVSRADVHHSQRRHQLDARRLELQLHNPAHELEHEHRGYRRLFVRLLRQLGLLRVRPGLSRNKASFHHRTGKLDGQLDGRWNGRWVFHSVRGQQHDL